MHTKNDLKQIVKDDWGSAQEASLCLTIIDYVSSEDVIHVTFGSLMHVVGKAEPTDVMRVIQYLSGPRAHVLETKFEYIEDDDSIFPISTEEVAQAYKTGYLIHPQTGEEIVNFTRNVCIYYEPAPGLRSSD